MTAQARETLKKVLLAIIVLAVCLSVARLGYGLYRLFQVKKQAEEAYMRDGLEAAEMIKADEVRFFQTRGTWPASNVELGIPRPHDFVGDSMTNLTISPGGVITLTFDARSGVKQGIVHYVPWSPPGMEVQWECTTPSYSNAPNWSPPCHYVP
jgi:hypothetical protein